MTPGIANIWPGVVEALFRGTNPKLATNNLLGRETVGLIKSVVHGSIALAMLSTAAFAMDKSPAPEGAEVYIVSPENGATVTSPVKVVFGLSGMGVAPAGIDHEHTGHHHLIIDAPLPNMDQPIPADDNYKHFGKGQTETTIELAPGKHTLQLLMGNFIHVPHADAVASDVIEITVK